MTCRALIDSNIWLYADDTKDPAKQPRATEIVEHRIALGTAVVSTQVLQEYYVNAIRKLHLPADVAREKVEILASLPVVQVDPPLILAAVDLHQRHQLSFWDALIVQAAVVGGCRELLTEDLQHGATIAGVRVVDPFR